MNPDFDPSPAASASSKAGAWAWRGPVIVLMLLAAAGYFIGWPHRAEQAGAERASENRDQNPVAVAVTPLRTVTLHSRVDGELIRVAFSEGQQVKQGEVLAEIDPRAFQVQLQQAQGQLLHDEALLKNAEIDLERYRTLLEQDSIAAQQTATQEALVKQYRGTVEVDRAQVANAELQLSYTKITAPLSGRAGLRLVDQGNLVHANDANGLVVVTQLQPISVLFTLPEDSVQAVMRRWHAAETLPIEAYDRAGRQKLADGKLLALDNQIDPATGTFKLKAQFENTDKALFPNQFVNIKMKLDNWPSATLVPAAAIQQGAAGSFVYVVKDDNTVSVSAVKLGPGLAETVAVLEGLAPGQKVVVDGADKLREGSRVKVIPADGAPVANDRTMHRRDPA